MPNQITMHACIASTSLVFLNISSAVLDLSTLPVQTNNILIKNRARAKKRGVLRGDISTVGRVQISPGPPQILLAHLHAYILAVMHDKKLACRAWSGQPLSESALTFLNAKSTIDKAFSEKRMHARA